MMGLFNRDQRGAVALMFALAAIPLLFALGMAVDHASNVSKQGKLQAALDAGALAAAASSLDDAQRIALAENVFRQNMGELADSITPVFVIDGLTVSGNAALESKNAFMTLAGIGTTSVTAESVVRIPTDRPAEIALVLDYSSSMNGQGKWQAMRDAALDLVNTVTDNGTNSNIKFGLVPFAKQVRMTIPSDYIVGEAPGSDWTGCTQDRKWPHNTTDETPDTFDDDTKWGLTPTAAGTCNQMGPHNLTILPLTNNHQAVTDQLNAMDPFVGTHIALGLEFGWHVISDNPPFTEGLAYGTDELLKAIVLLTDGKQTTKAWGQNDSHSRSNGEENLEDMCQAIKAKDVLMITIVFDLNDGETETRMRNCATTPDYYFDADNNQQLAEAFQSIGALLKQQIYVSR